MRMYSTILSMTLIMVNFPSYAQMQCKCHSKQPAMKRMHEVIGFSGCGNCHSKNENLMSGKTQKDPDMKANLAKRIREDTACIPCHDSKGAIKKGVYSNSNIMGISGTLYCPKDRLRFSAGTKSCSKCGGILVNIDQLMAKSRSNPSNGICKECHTLEEAQKINKHSTLKIDQLNGCLNCHKGHGDCGSCHH